jgi:hypothetical protein
MDWIFYGSILLTFHENFELDHWKKNLQSPIQMWVKPLKDFFLKFPKCHVYVGY